MQRPRRMLLLALRTMVAQNVRRVPVVDDDSRLVGIISIDDFLLHARPGKAEVLTLETLEALKNNYRESKTRSCSRTEHALAAQI